MKTSPDVTLTGRPRTVFVAVVLALTASLVLALVGQVGVGGFGDRAAGEDVAAEAAPAAMGLEVALARPGSVDDVAAAEKALTDFLRAKDQAFRRADGTSPEVKPFVTQAMADDVRGQLADMAMQKFRQRGAVRVIEVTPVVASGNGSELVLEACLGTSGIEILDPGGQDVLDQQRGKTRSLHVYTLTSDGGTWKVAGHSFPDDPAC